MTTHELAYLLISQEDVPVVFLAYNGCYHTADKLQELTSKVVVHMRSETQELAEEMVRINPPENWSTQ